LEYSDMAWGWRNEEVPKKRQEAVGDYLRRDL
jgi:hypothetical protein